MRGWKVEKKNLSEADEQLLFFLHIPKIDIVVYIKKTVHEQQIVFNHQSSAIIYNLVSCVSLIYNLIKFT